MRILLVVLLLLALGACAQPSEVDAGEGGEPTSDLTITVTSDPGADPVTWTLSCDPPGGTHPDPAGACAAVEAQRDSFAGVPADMMCTQVYGGPETATITGQWKGKQIDASFRRTDGCEIARWDTLAVVFGSG